MFEQSLFNQEPAETPVSHEGDLFNNYEIRNWNYSPRLYKIIAASAAVNLLALLVVAQTSLLTMKGCDSPFVGKVCQVLDTVYVSSLLFGTDREYVDQAYQKTELADADVTFVDVSNDTPPLEYPEGYFALANPGQASPFAQVNDPLAGYNPSNFPPVGQVPPAPQDNLLNQPQNLPKPNPNAVTGPLPSFDNDNTEVAVNPKKGRGGKIKDSDANSNTETPKTAEPAPTPLSSDAVTSLEINKKPLTDFADSVLAQWSANQIDFNQPFTVVLNGVLTNDGKLDRDKSKFDPSKQKGDQKMIDLAKAALEAVGDSGFLTYLRSLDVEKVDITLTQDDKQITAVVSSGQKTADRAKTISSGMNTYLMIGKATAKNPSDERTLLDGAKVTTDGKNFVLNFAIPKDVAQEMINRKLKEAQAKKQQQMQQPNSSDPSNKPGQNLGE